MMPEGLLVTASAHGPAETMQKLIAAVADKGLSVLAHVDHAGAAAVRHGVENGKVVAAMREMLAVLAAKATQ